MSSDDTRRALRAEAAHAVTERLDGDPRVTRLGMDAATLFHGEDFFSEAECAALVAQIDRDRRPSSTYTEDGPSLRTSDSCDMDRYSQLVQPLDERFAELLGIDPRRGETMQGQRYAPGQQFGLHNDWFDETASYWQIERGEGGQRSWTAMVYLNDVDEGGETVFPRLGLSIAPRTGLLLCWNNMNPDGSPNDMTVHEGSPPASGVKYIVTKWFRETNWL